MKYAALLALLACGCSPVAENARGRTALESRAAFDFQCPEGALAIAPLGKDSHGVITSYGVEGCGRRATYVRLADSTWLMNPPEGAPAMASPRPMRVPVQHPPARVPLPPSAQPRPQPAPPPSGSVERSPEQPPSSLHPRRGEPGPKLPELPGQGERPSPLGPSR